MHVPGQYSFVLALNDLKYRSNPNTIHNKCQLLNKKPHAMGNHTQLSAPIFYRIRTLNSFSASLLWSFFAISCRLS